MTLDHFHRPVFSAWMLALGLCGSSFAADPQPTMTYVTPMTKAAHDSPLGAKVNQECNQLYHLLLDPDTMFNAEKRKTLLATAKPLLLQYRADFNQLATDNPSMSKDAVAIDEQTTQRLALLGDDETLKMLQADADGSDTVKSAKAQCVLIENAWTLAENKETQEKLVDSLDKLAHDHPESENVTALLLKLSTLHASRPMHDRLVDLAVNVTDNPMSKKMDGLKHIQEASVATSKLVGKPFVVSGKTPDGKDFTTADWKGKVVMVDFWATWCGPCKEQLPTIKKLYEEKHGQGFEIVSVSNDFDLDALKKYTAENNMPWPELIDAEAAKKKTWNPMTLHYGIDGIPHSFVIDKKGNLLTANAGLGYKDVIEKALAEN